MASSHYIITRILSSWTCSSRTLLCLIRSLFGWELFSHGEPGTNEPTRYKCGASKWPRFVWTQQELLTNPVPRCLATDLPQGFCLGCAQLLLCLFGWGRHGFPYSHTHYQRRNCFISKFWLLSSLIQDPCVIHTPVTAKSAACRKKIQE